MVGMLVYFEHDKIIFGNPDCKYSQPISSFRPVWLKKGPDQGSAHQYIFWAGHWKVDAKAIFTEVQGELLRAK